MLFQCWRKKKNVKISRGPQNFWTDAYCPGLIPTLTIMSSFLQASAFLGFFSRLSSGYESWDMHVSISQYRLPTHLVKDKRSDSIAISNTLTSNKSGNDGVIHSLAIYMTVLLGYLTLRLLYYNNELYDILPPSLLNRWWFVWDFYSQQ